MNWTVGGVERTALVYPPSAKSEAAVPLIFSFHGHSGNAQASANAMGLQSAWPQALVVYMQGLPTPSKLDPEGKQTGWQPQPGIIERPDYNMGDRDLKFFDAVLSKMRENYKVDNRRIYATGFSNGAMFTYLLWSTRGNTFAAIAACAGMATPELKLGNPLPVLHIAGEKDTTIPLQLQEKTIERIRKHNGCSNEGTPVGAHCILYPASRGGAPVMTLIHSGGHTVPPGTGRLIARFFGDHPKAQ